MGRKNPSLSRLQLKSRLSASQQSAILTQKCPSFRCVQRGREFVWEGTIQPRPLSVEYTVRIAYKDKSFPKVMVVKPPIQLKNNGIPTPHLYKGGLLCLHLSEEWSGSDIIADTIVPWISLWLYYYEIWLATGEWLGGGEHLPPSEYKIPQEMITDE